MDIWTAESWREALTPGRVTTVVCALLLTAMVAPDALCGVPTPLRPPADPRVGVLIDELSGQGEKRADRPNEEEVTLRARKLLESGTNVLLDSLLHVRIRTEQSSSRQERGKIQFAAHYLVGSAYDDGITLNTHRMLRDLVAVLEEDEPSWQGMINGVLRSAAFQEGSAAMDFSSFDVILSDREATPLRQVIEFMFTRDPFRALAECAETYLPNPKMRDSLLGLAKHVAPRRGGIQDGTTRATALASLAKDRRWWVRLYAKACVSRDASGIAPDARAALRKRLDNDSHPIVAEFMRLGPSQQTKKVKPRALTKLMPSTCPGLPEPDPRTQQVLADVIAAFASSPSRSRPEGVDALVRTLGEYRARGVNIVLQVLLRRCSRPRRTKSQRREHGVLRSATDFVLVRIYSITEVGDLYQLLTDLHPALVATDPRVLLEVKEILSNTAGLRIRHERYVGYLRERRSPPGALMGFLHDRAPPEAARALDSVYGTEETRRQLDESISIMARDNRFIRDDARPDDATLAAAMAEIARLADSPHWWIRVFAKALLTEYSRYRKHAQGRLLLKKLGASRVIPGT